jgi:hypothetical protein
MVWITAVSAMSGMGWLVAWLQPKAEQWAQAHPCHGTPHRHSLASRPDEPMR